uniref:Uncharacterized protein TCIL3000_1_1860 n=1 Tax=Trypanosoma congolense (strain IL3000) TaxID=1068625 RepID=G0UJ68_TRYCI|nr:unnamed protein product [Trypanosoma congolense IL3000]
MSMEEECRGVQLNGAINVKALVEGTTEGLASMLSTGSSPALTNSLLSTSALECSTLGDSFILESHDLPCQDAGRCESSNICGAAGSCRPPCNYSPPKRSVKPVCFLKSVKGERFTGACSAEESSMISVVQREIPLVLSSLRAKSISCLHDIPETVLRGVLPYLCLPEVVALLRTSKKLNGLTREYFAVNEQRVMRIPVFDTRSFMQYRPERKPQTCKAAPEGPAPKSPGVKPIRLFFGQQRRDPHPSALRRLLRFIAPDLLITHMEAHTSSGTGRGKGCAWVVVPSVAEAKRLLLLSGRIFLDVNSDGEEVYMFGPLTCRKWLHNYAEHVTEVTPRQSHLPRQPMVVEIPRKSGERNGLKKDVCVKHSKQNVNGSEQAPLNDVEYPAVITKGLPQHKASQTEQLSVNVREIAHGALTTTDTSADRHCGDSSEPLGFARAGLICTTVHYHRPMLPCKPHGCWKVYSGDDKVQLKKDHSSNTSTMWLGTRRYRHDPYASNLLCSMGPVQRYRYATQSLAKVQAATNIIDSSW